MRPLISMKKTKELIRHELLNILMLMDILMCNDELDEGKKKQISDLIKLAGLLIAHENIFLEKKSQFFEQKVNLREILEIIVAIHEKKISNHNIKIILPKDDFFVKTDKRYIEEAFEKIIKKMMNSVTSMEFKFDNRNKKITIFSKEGGMPKLNKKRLIQSLSNKNLLNNEIALQLALEIFNLNKIKLTSEKNKVTIVFPHQ